MIGEVAVSAHYDQLDALYRDCWGERLHHGLWTRGDERVEDAIGALADRAAAPLVLENGGHLVDVGCGYGVTARTLSGRHGLTATGYTVSRCQVERARLSPREGVEILMGDWLENALPDASADAVISIECLSHVADKAAFFREIGRVLKPGGRASVLCWTLGGHADADLVAKICEGGALAGIGASADYCCLIEEAGMLTPEPDDLTGRVSGTWDVIWRRAVWRSLTRWRYFRFILARPVASLRFAGTVRNLRRAYASDVLRYSMFVMERPAQAV